MNLILMSYLISQVTDYLINHLVHLRANSVIEIEIIYSFILDIYLIYVALKKVECTYIVLDINISHSTLNFKIALCFRALSISKDLLNKFITKENT